MGDSTSDADTRSQGWDKNVEGAPTTCNERSHEASCSRWIRPRHVSMRTRPLYVSTLQRAPERRAWVVRPDADLVDRDQAMVGRVRPARASDRRVGRELDRSRAGEARGIAVATRIWPPSSRTEPTLSTTFGRDLDQLKAGDQWPSDLPPAFAPPKSSSRSVAVTSSDLFSIATSALRSTTPMQQASADC